MPACQREPGGVSRAFPSFQRSTRNRTCACACMRLQVCRRWKDRITVCNPPRLCSSHLRMCSSLIVVMTAVRTVHATTHQPCSLPRGRPLRRPLPEASTAWAPHACAPSPSAAVLRVEHSTWLPGWGCLSPTSRWYRIPSAGAATIHSPASSQQRLPFFICN